MRGNRVLRSLAFISALEGIFFVAYGVLIGIGVLTFGLTGPEAVSNPGGVTLEVLIFLVFGAGLLLTAAGWWKVRRWARSPFVLAQMLALVVSIPLATALGSVEKLTGLVVTGMAGIGLVLSLLPATTARLYRAATPPESG